MGLLAHMSRYNRTEYLTHNGLPDLEKKHKEAVEFLLTVSDILMGLRRTEEAVEISAWLQENHPELGYCRRVDPVRP